VPPSVSSEFFPKLLPIARSLLEAVTKDELADEGEYNEIVEDMRDECGKYGSVRKLALCFVPRAGPCRVPCSASGFPYLASHSLAAPAPEPTNSFRPPAVVSAHVLRRSGALHTPWSSCAR